MFVNSEFSSSVEEKGYINLKLAPSTALNSSTRSQNSTNCSPYENMMITKCEPDHELQRTFESIKKPKNNRISVFPGNMDKEHNFTKIASTAIELNKAVDWE